MSQWFKAGSANPTVVSKSGALLSSPPLQPANEKPSQQHVSWNSPGRVDLMCDWAKMENEHHSVLMGAYWERVLGVFQIKLFKKARLCLLMSDNNSLRAVGSEESLRFTKILIQLLRFLEGFLRACKQVGTGWELNLDSLCPRALFTRLSLLADTLPVTHIYDVRSERTHPSKLRNCFQNCCDLKFLRISVPLVGKARTVNLDNPTGTVLMHHERMKSLWKEKILS